MIDSNGDTVAVTRTKQDGTYEFTNVKNGEYRVIFDKVADRSFTKHDVGDTDMNTDASTVDSDANTDMNEYGVATMTISITNTNKVKTDVDVGVGNVTDAAITLEKGVLENNQIVKHYRTARYNDFNVTFRITNTGDEKLVGVEMTDKTTKGVDSVRDIQCGFDKEFVNGREMSVLVVGQTVDCVGVLNISEVSVNNETVHEDEATVTAYGAESFKKVSDSSVFDVVTTYDVTHGDSPSPEYDRLPMSGSYVIAAFGVLFVAASAGGAYMLLGGKKPRDDAKDDE